MDHNFELLLFTFSGMDDVLPNHSPYIPKIMKVSSNNHTCLFFKGKRSPVLILIIRCWTGWCKISVFEYYLIT